MSATYKDSFFEKLKNEYDFLVDLPIGVLYPLFYSEVARMKNSDPYCESFPTENHHEIFNYRSICKNSQNVLSYLNGMVHANPLYNNTKLCEYLSYYIYENILNCNSCNDIEQLNKKLNNLILYYRNLPNNCNIKNFKIAKDAFIKKKKLYLLGEILYSIKEKYGRVSYVNPDLYNTFFRECVNIYKKIVHADNCEIKKEYEKELNDFIDNFNKEKAYLNENNKEISHDNIQSFNASTCQQELYKNQAEVLLDPADSQAVKEDAVHKGREDEAQAVVLEEHSLEEVSGSRAGVEDHTVHMRDRGSDVSIEQTDDNISSPVGTIIGTSLGFVVPLITIYKFTPLGSWISTRILGRNKILKIMERNNQHLLLNSTENKDINLGDTMYRIKYNS